MNAKGHILYKQIRLVRFFLNGSYMDCTFKIKGEVIKAHKLILACNSPVFEKMLFGVMSSDEIELNDIKVEEFKRMLDFIYMETISFSSVSDAWSMFYIAKKYMIDDLDRKCLAYISVNLTLSNLVLSYEYSELYCIEELREQCLEIIAEIASGIFSGDYHMKSSTLKALLDRRIILSKAELVCRILQWAETECTYRDLTVDCHSIVQILKEEEILPYIKKSWLLSSCCSHCDTVISKCLCYGQTIFDTLSYLSSDATWEENNIIISDKMLSTCPPTLCKSRKVLKIARRMDFQENEEFVTTVAVNRNVMVTGVQILTEMSNLASFTEDYIGKVTIRFSEQNLKEDLVKPTVLTYRSYYNTQVFVLLSNPVTMSSEKLFDIKISYTNLTSNLKSSVVCNYMYDILEKQANDATIYFFEIHGGLVKGLSFYPV